MKKFYESLREYAKNINFEEKNFTVNKRRIKIISRCKNMLYSLKKIFKMLCKSKKYQKVRDHCHHIGKYRWYM